MEELSRECLMETLDVFSGLKRIGGSEDEHRACGYLIKKLQEWGIPCRVYECDGYVSTPIEASVTVEGMDQTFEALPRSFSAHCPDGVTAPLFYDVHAHDQLKPRQEQDWYAGARGCIVIGDNFYEDYVQKLRGYGSICGPARSLCFTTRRSALCGAPRSLKTEKPILIFRWWA